MNGPIKRRATDNTGEHALIVSSSDLAQILTAVSNLSNKVENLAKMVEEEIAPKVNEVTSILEKSKGVVIFLKWIIPVGAASGTLIYWIKEHVKF